MSTQPKQSGLRATWSHISYSAASTTSADKLADALSLSLNKTVQWKNAKRDPATWLLEIGGKIVAEVQQQDNGEWRWQRFSTIAEHGLPPGAGKATSRRDAQKKAWPK